MALQCDLAAEEKHLGVLGQLAPAIASGNGCAQASARLRDGSARRSKLFWRKPSFQEIPKFPSILRDIAVVCPMAMSYGRIENEIWASDPEFLVKVEPLSVFVDPIGRKAAAGPQICRDLLDIPCLGEDAQ